VGEVTALLLGGPKHGLLTTVPDERFVISCPYTDDGGVTVALGFYRPEEFSDVTRYPTGEVARVYRVWLWDEAPRDGGPEYRALVVARLRPSTVIDTRPRLVDFG